MSARPVQITTGLAPESYSTTRMYKHLDFSECLSTIETAMHPSGLCCQECGCKKRVGGGKTAKGMPRYRCTNCGSTYTVISYTPFAGSTLCPRKIVVLMWLLGLEQRIAVIAEAIDLSVSAASVLVAKITTYARLAEDS